MELLYFSRIKVKLFRYNSLVNHCEHLLVYDWDGNPIKHYILDIPMWSMQYDIEKNSIYGIAYNPEGGFIEYQFSKVERH